MMGTGPTAIWGDGREWRGYRTGRYTCAVYKKDGKEFLFDNLDDPYQLRKLADDGSKQEIRNGLRSAMLGKMKQVGDNFDKNAFYKKHRVKDRKILPVLVREK